MTSYTTTCPFCQAKFLINQEQLKLKAGKARCGKCAKVFQANEHLSQIKTAAPQTSQSAADNSSLLNTNKNIHNNSHSTQASSVDPKPKEQPVLFSDDTEIDEPISDSSNNMDNDDIDLSGIFGDEIASEFKNTMTDMQAVNPFDVSITDQNSLSNTNNPNLSDEKWVESLLAEESEADMLDKSKQEQSDDLMGFLEDIGAHTTQISTISQNNLEEAKDVSLPNIAATKASLAKVPKKKKNLGLGKIFSSLIWATLTLGAILTLAAQYLYFNYDTLARDQQGREHLALACSFVGCELPNVNADDVVFKEIKTRLENSKTTLSFVLHNQSNESILIPAVKVTLFKNNQEVGANVIFPNQYLHGSYKKLPVSQPLDGKINLGVNMSSFDQISLDAIY